MSLGAVQRILGLLLMLFSVTMLPALGVSLFMADGAWLAFVVGFATTLAAGVVSWAPVARNRTEMRLRDGFLVVALFWVVLGVFGAAPLWFSVTPQMSFTEAVFESMSGLTTTGATVLVGLDSLPASILYYRQQLQWLGGMGIIVLAVAVLPMLGVGGMQLYRAETPGPMKDTKLTPRITETAKALWYVYFAITLICALAYWLAGMTPFDAIGHAFSTVAIGGFSTHDLSIGYYDSKLIDLIAIFFMLAAGLNFSLHFLTWRNGRITHYLLDPESRAYFTILGAATLGVVAYLSWAQTFADLSDTFVHSLFQVVSIGTTTGFTTADYSAWPGAVPVLLLLISFVGGCAGSTGGGMKVIRWVLIYKQGMREIMRLVHPSAEIPIRLGQKGVSPRIVESVWGFFAMYVSVFALMMLAMMMTGLDQVTAFSAVAASLNNLGPALGDASSNFAGINDAAKWVSIAAMLLGRLEIFTLVVLFSRTFWRR